MSDEDIDEMVSLLGTQPYRWTVTGFARYFGYSYRVVKEQYDRIIDIKHK